MSLNKRSQHFSAGTRPPGKPCLLRSAALAGMLCLLLSPITQAQDDIREILSPDHLPPQFFTFTPDEYWQERQETYWTGFANWVIEQERTQSKRIQALGAWADRTLSGNPRSMPNNASYLRLGLAGEARTGELASLEPEARFKLDLPTAEEKLRIVLESDSDELVPLGERKRNRQITSDERTETDATGALRLLSQVSDSINLSNDIGARLRLPPDAFWRVSARGTWRPNSDWRLSARQRLYYFHQEGWGASAWLGLGRDLGNGWTFFASSEAVWKHDDREFQLAQVFDFQKRLNNRSELNPRFGVLGESQPSWRHTSVFTDLTWRYRIYHDWLYGEVIPGVEFTRDNNFDAHTSLILRVEMFFSGNLLAR